MNNINSILIELYSLINFGLIKVVNQRKGEQISRFRSKVKFPNQSISSRFSFFKIKYEVLTINLSCRFQISWIVSFLYQFILSKLHFIEFLCFEISYKIMANLSKKNW
jgi:hypothetical protein